MNIYCCDDPSVDVICFYDPVGYECRGVSVRLACGHFSPGLISDRSSFFDHPDESHFCAICLKDYQWSLRVQARLGVGDPLVEDARTDLTDW